MSEKKSGPAGARRTAARPLADLTSRVLAPVIARRAGMTLDLVNAWEEIAGPRHAVYSRPEKIAWPRRASEDDPFQPGTLIVACEGGRAIWLQHESGELIERVNVFFGFPAIARLRIVQKPLVRIGAAKPAPLPELDAASRNRLEAMLSAVEDEGLRARLEKLGKGVIARQLLRSSRDGGGKGGQ